MAVALIGGIPLRPLQVDMSEPVRGIQRRWETKVEFDFAADPEDDETVTVSRAQLRRVLRDMALTVTGMGVGDQVFDRLKEVTRP